MIIKNGCIFIVINITQISGYQLFNYLIFTGSSMLFINEAMSFLRLLLVAAAFTNALPIMAPLEYTHAFSKVFPSEIPKPISVGFFNFMAFICLKKGSWASSISPLAPVVLEEETIYIKQSECSSINRTLLSEVCGVMRNTFFRLYFS